jgi:hypothetical protein
LFTHPSGVTIPSAVDRTSRDRKELESQATQKFH